MVWYPRHVEVNSPYLYVFLYLSMSLELFLHLLSLLSDGDPPLRDLPLQRIIFTLQK